MKREAAAPKQATKRAKPELKPAIENRKPVDVPDISCLEDRCSLSCENVTMPIVGFGTYQLKKEAAIKPVVEALKLGYRLLDTASIYENEKFVAQAIAQSGVAREEIFLETKVWRSHHGYERTITALTKSMKQLNVAYLDLVLIHWPGCKTGWPLKAGTTSPPDWTPEMRYTGTWRALEDLHLEGKIRAIGVSNYSRRHVQEILDNCRIKPHVLQAEYHPKLIQSDMIEFCKQHGIRFQAYASLGQGMGDLLKQPAVARVARAQEKSRAQVLLRWALQKGVCILPRSTNPAHIAENASIFDFKLSSEEMASIDELNCNQRLCWNGVDPDSVE